MSAKPVDSDPSAAARPDESADLRARLDVLWNGARDGLWDWDLERRVLRLSPRWKALLGFAEQEIGERPEEWLRRVHPRDLEELKKSIDALTSGTASELELELRLLHRDGGWRRVVCRAVARAGGRLVGGSLSDVTEKKLLEDRYLHEVHHDPLTGLPNRALFLDRLALSLSRVRRRRESTSLAVLFLDLDRFHSVNDGLGAPAGDRMLVQVTRRLEALVREGDTLAHFGADKFALLLDGVREAPEAMAFAREVDRVLRAPLELAGHELFPSATIGIALSTSASTSAEDLLRDADTAMYRAKGDPTRVFEVFDPETSTRARARMRMEADLHRAMERGEFLLHYQPIISFRTGRLSAFEALLRWKHPERGLVRPDVFIPIAEENGLIVPLGRWVLEMACAQMKHWHDTLPNGRELAISVNLSARQFEDPQLVPEVRRTMELSGIEPGTLELEMTESVVMARTRENALTLQALRDLGVRLMIDDFGTGYSSLASLHTFPLDTLKIDRSFVSRMEFEEEKAEIVRTILTLAGKLGLEAVAEGVETAEELRMLRELECQHGQGYYFSSAIDADSAAAWIQSAPRW
jgi:diguanylate cyclase (GGDEF)-like protein/PAS domain S-box-containing protein